MLRALCLPNSCWEYLPQVALKSYWEQWALKFISLPVFLFKSHWGEMQPWVLLVWSSPSPLTPKKTRVVCWSSWNVLLWTSHGLPPSYFWLCESVFPADWPHEPWWSHRGPALSFLESQSHRIIILACAVVLSKPCFQPPAANPMCASKGWHVLATRVRKELHQQWCGL